MVRILTAIASALRLKVHDLRRLSELLAGEGVCQQHGDRAKRLVSWHLSRCAAKQCGCEILEAAGPGPRPGPSCSLIRSRAVLSNSNSYWSDQAASRVGQAARPARIQAGVIYL